jgi:hypothetical protein
MTNVSVATGNCPMTASRSLYQTLQSELALIGVTRVSRVPNAEYVLPPPYPVILVC